MCISLRVVCGMRYSRCPELSGYIVAALCMLTLSGCGPTRSQREISESREVCNRAIARFSSERHPGAQRWLQWYRQSLFIIDEYAESRSIETKPQNVAITLKWRYQYQSTGAAYSAENAPRVVEIQWLEIGNSTSGFYLEMPGSSMRFQERWEPLMNGQIETFVRHQDVIVVSTREEIERFPGFATVVIPEEAWNDIFVANGLALDDEKLLRLPEEVVETSIQGGLSLTNGEVAKTSNVFLELDDFMHVSAK